MKSFHNIEMRIKIRLQSNASEQEGLPVCGEDEGFGPDGCEEQSASDDAALVNIPDEVESAGDQGEARERPGKGFLIPMLITKRLEYMLLAGLHGKGCLAKFALTTFESSNLCHV